MGSDWRGTGLEWRENEVGLGGEWGRTEGERGWTRDWTGVELMRWDWGMELGGWDGGRLDKMAGKFPKFHFVLLTCHLMWTSFILRVLVSVK